MKGLFLFSAMMVVCACSNAALNFSDVTVEYWTGTGQNESLVIFDFNPQESFAFGYRWDGAKTTFDALLAIDSASEDFSMSYSWNDGVGGYFIEGFSYLDTQPRGSSWSLYTSTDGEMWSESWDGASDRVLTNGSWDGWASGDFVWVGPGDWDYVFTGSVRTPTPEPVTAVLLGLGVLFGCRRNYKQ